MKVLRVVHMVNRLAVAGTEYNVIKLVNRLDRARFFPIICALRVARPDAAALVASHVPIWECRRQEGLDLLLILRLARLLKSEDIDIVHTHNWSTLVYGVLASRLAGVSVIVHGEHGLEIDTLVEPARRRWARRAIGSVIDRLVGVSSETVQRIQSEWCVSKGKISYIPNGVELERFGNCSRSGEIRARLNIEANDPVIAAVGGLRPIKDLATLVRAFALLEECHPRAHLLLIGLDVNQQFQRQIERDAAQLQWALSRIRYLGLRLDIPDLLAAVDVYCNSSLYEGMSNTILEAMASRKPIVATAVGGTPSLVSDGDNGYLVPPGDAKAMADRILCLLADPACARRMGLSGRDRIERNHSFARVVAQHASLYDSLHARKGRPLAAVDRAKIAVAGLSRAIGVTLVAERLSRGSLAVLTYHRILPYARKLLSPSQAMITTEEVFDLQMAELARRYRPLSLAEVLEHFRTNTPFPPHAVHVTFDDGYADNFEYALPILVRHSIPATLFLATGPLDTGQRLWWDEVSDALALLSGRHPLGLEDALVRCVAPLHPLVQRIAASDGIVLRDIDRCVGILNRIDEAARQITVATLAALAKPYRSGAPVRLMLTWDEVRSMQRSGVALGGHTVSHSYLDAMDDETGRREVSECVTRIEQETGINLRAFSYPAGRVSKRSRAWLAECDIEVAMTTVLGVNRCSDDPYSIKRSDAGYLAVRDRYVAAHMRLELAGVMNGVSVSRRYR